MSVINHQFRLAARRPVGLPERSDWSLTEEPVREPGEGEFLVKILYHLARSGDAGLDERGTLLHCAGRHRRGDAGAARRARHRLEAHRSFAVGDAVAGPFGVQEYALSKGDGVTKVDPAVAPLPVYPGRARHAGMTAYFGLLEVGKPKPGQTVVVSGAAGAVGTVVGQIARSKAAASSASPAAPRSAAISSANSGFDAAIDYKSEDVRKALRQHCPKGIDVYFDNVGGDILDAVLANLARHARIVICGAISQYNNTTAIKGPRNYLSLLVNRASMNGMVVFDYADRYAEASKHGRLDRRGQAEVARGHRRQGLRPFPRRCSSSSPARTSASWC